MYVRVDSTKTTALDDLAGTFWSDEIMADLTFSVRDGALYYAFPRQDEPTPLTPLFRDAFADGELVFQFVRNSGRQVTGVTKHWDRVWNLDYVRKARRPAPKPNEHPARAHAGRGCSRGDARRGVRP